jgi:transposase
MLRRVLTDEQWQAIEGLLPGKASDRGRTAKDNRRFVEAVLWLARTGSPWRDLPPEFGNWHSTYVRFARWRDAGLWDRIAVALAGERDLAQVFIDSTLVRAHQHASGAQKKPVRKRSGARAGD